MILNRTSKKKRLLHVTLGQRFYKIRKDRRVSKKDLKRGGT